MKELINEWRKFINEAEQMNEEQLDPDKYYLMDGGRVYKGPFDSYEEADAKLIRLNELV